jgi:hypothetical protein
MRYCKTKHDIIIPVLVIVLIFTIFGYPLGLDRYAYSQSFKTSSAANAVGAGVDLVNTRTSPLHLKAGSKFEIFSNVVNTSPNIITFIAGRCHSPLSATFARNVMIRHAQGCTTASPSFKLNPGEQVSVAGPSSGTTYQTTTSGQIRATAVLYYKTKKGQAANITKPFVFTVS